MTAEAEGSEILVIADPDTLAGPVVLASGTVLHTVSDRIVTVRLYPDASLDDVHSEPAVRWAGTDPPDTVLADLDPAERLFVDAWLRRRTEKPARPGEGLDWDTPGRLPPDPP